ncbi:translocation/assembly module TamB domain-containing protein [Herminiimonas fonticola]|uniref:translocation/assembly module TamB domain-containing protein n=1 Tax=Herminiimonas fonticola TaxID=303380 RepID=UPI00333EF04C
MASNTPDHAPAGLLKRTRRVWLPLLAAIAITIGAGLAWLLNSERGAQFALSTAASLSNGVLQTKDVSGHLNGSLHIAQLGIQLENQKIVLDDIQLDTQLAKLLTGKLHVTALQIGKLAIVNKIDQVKEPAKLPDSISLPLHLQIDKVKVRGGEIGWGPLNVVTLGAFSFDLDFDGKRYVLNLDQLSARGTANAAAFDGNFQGQATLATSKPYALQATISSYSEARIDNRNIGANGQLDLRGSLQELAAAINLQIGQATVKGQAILRPFAEQLLGATDLTAQALDLAVLSTDLPQTALHIQLSAAENGSGNLTMENTAAGLLNDARLPLRKLQIDFAQNDEQFSFSHILAEFGNTNKSAGKIEGNGRYAKGALALNLQTDALDVKKLDSRMRASRLSGSLDMHHADGKQNFTLALSEPLKKNKLTLNAQALIADESVSISKAELRAGNSEVLASAHYGLNGKQTFDAKGLVRNFQLRDLGDFPQLPALHINGDFSLRGARLPALEADIALNIRDSQLAGRPLSGEAQAKLHGDTLQVSKLLLNAGDNRLTAQGKLADDNASVVFALHAPALAQLGSGFGGAVQIDGEIRGKVQQPRIVATWQGKQIRLPGPVQIDGTEGKADVALNLDANRSPSLINSANIRATAHGINADGERIANLSAQTQFALPANAPVAITVRADGITGPRLRAESFKLDVSGSTSQHALSATLLEREQNWRLTASGGLQTTKHELRWQGAINTLDASGKLAAKLAAPAPLLLSQKLIQLDRFQLNSDHARITMEQFIRNERGIATRGKFEHVQIASLLQSLQAAPAIAGDLKLAGEWNLSLYDQADGTFSVRRESGDIVMRNNAAIALGLNTLNATVNANKGRIAARLLVDGRQSGQIDVSLNTSMGGATRFSIAPNAPLSGRLRINTPMLGWLGPMISPTLMTEGSLQGDVALAGTFAQPQLTGPVNADKLRLRFTDTGIDLKQGTLRSEFRNDQLLISNLSFQNEGSLTISGPLSLVREQLALELAIKVEHYKLIDRSDRKLVISGNSVVGWREGSAKANGKFEVNSGFVDISASDAPALSDDVVIVGRGDSQGKKAVIALDIEIGLGDGIRLRGRGIDALLLGQLHLLAGAGDNLRAQGNLRVASGTFKAYGRELAIEQGLLRFSGPLNNPALDILAMRRGQEVEAGVSVRGTVLSPRITLVSEPTVPDAEKLSWLVLGRGLSGTTDSDLGALQSAASSLLTQGAAGGLQSQIATAFGLDDFSIGSSDTNLQERIVMLGKQISSKLYVSYKQGLESASSVLLLRYTLTPRITLEGEAGTSSALSLFYNFAFD